MTLSSEAWLMLLVVVLYLQDSALALEPNEAVLERAALGRWRARFGAQHWKLMGRELYFPAVFAPHRALFRLRWRMDGQARPVHTGRQVAVPREIGSFAPFVWVAWVALFVLLPLGLFSPLGTPLSLAAVALLYVNNLLALTLTYRWRDRLRVDRRAVLKLAVECLACAPYSVNLVRRLCALMASKEDFTHAAARLLDGPALALVKAQCLARIDEQIEAEPQGSPRMVLLESARLQFQEQRGR